MVVVSVLLPVSILILCLVIAAFFSFAETALIGVPRHKVRLRADEGHPGARLLNRMMDEPERILTTVLVGNNVVNIGATAYATVVALALFGEGGALIATGTMAVLITIATEIVPKTFAVQRPLPISLAVARPLRIVEVLLLPVVTLLTAFSRVVARFGGKRPTTKAPFITQEEIDILVREGVKEGEVDHFAHKVLQELFDFGDTNLTRFMTPRDQIQYVTDAAVLREAADMAFRAGRTRLLVVGKSLDDVLGCVHVKDLLRVHARGISDAPVSTCLRPVLMTASDRRPDDLLRQMQKSHSLMAVIQDATRSTLGIITLEDLLEELLGEIEDETKLSMGR